MRLFKNIPHKLELSVTDLNGDFVSSLLINYEVRKCLDNSVISSGTMSEINFVYTKEITLTEIGEYRVKYITPLGYENGFENIIVDEYDNYKADVSDLALEETLQLIKTETDKIKNILGLSQENFRIFNPTYDANHNLLTSTIKIYPTKADCIADTNSIAIYSVVATYDVNKDMSTYKVTKES